MFFRYNLRFIVLLVKTRKVIIKTLDKKDAKGKGKEDEKEETTSSEEDSSSTEDSSEEESSD